MKLSPTTYIPVVKWRQGEYQALLRLTDAAKARVVPLVVIPPIEFDFEAWAPKRTVQEHVSPFAKRFNDKWGPRAAWIDIDVTLQSAIMDSGLDVISHVFSELRKVKARAVPTASLDHPPSVRHAVGSVVSTDKLGVALRARLEHVMRPDFASKAAALLGELKSEVGMVDLLIDLGTPAYQPYTVFTGALSAALANIPNLDAYRTFAVLGTAFPETLKDILPPLGAIERHDWLFYRSLVAALPAGMRRPNYGDYTIVHPSFVAIDMRMIKPAGKLVYTSQNQWSIWKGGAFRDNPGQMQLHCDRLLKSGKFRGAGFSEGDQYIEQCAQKLVGSSTQTRWKEIAISHHTMHVLDDLAKFGGSP